MAMMSGGCLCGAVRYEAEGPLLDAGYCHCRMCQRQSGSPVMTWASVPAGTLRYVAGEPAVYRSSAIGERRFCARCGSGLEFRALADPDTVALNSGTLDDPSLAPPRKHIWTMSQVSWFVTADDLPDHPEDG